MGLLITARNSGADTGYVYDVTKTSANAYSFNSLAVPSRAVATKHLPQFARYDTKDVIAGKFSSLLVRTIDGVLYESGIAPPTYKPTIAGSGGSGVTGAMVGYFTFVHKFGDVVVWESDPGPASTSVSITSQSRAWTNLPPSSADSRVSHVRGYVSVDGALAKLAWEQSIGGSSITEAVATLSLGDTLVASGRRRAPFAKFCAVYHDRLWLAGSPAHPDRIYYSRLGEAEGFSATGYLRTRNGEAVTGLAVYGDTLLVFCMHSTYAIQGYEDFSSGGEADLSIHRISPRIGCISGYSIANVGSPSGGDFLMFASVRGVYAFDGGFRLMSHHIAPFWKSEYAANTYAFEHASGEWDPELDAYVLLLPYAAEGTAFVGLLEGMRQGEAQPWWALRQRARIDTAHGLIADTATGYPRLFTGSSDGHVRQENVAANVNDDGDTASKEMVVRTKHYYPDGAAGNKNQGRKFTSGEQYLKSENNPTTVGIYVGEEEAGSAAAATETITVAASQVAGKQAKYVHSYHLERGGGRGVAYKVRASNANGVEWKGFQQDFEAVGTVTRPAA